MTGRPIAKSQLLHPAASPQVSPGGLYTSARMYLFERIEQWTIDFPDTVGARRAGSIYGPGNLVLDLEIEGQSGHAVCGNYSDPVEGSALYND